MSTATRVTGEMLAAMTNGEVQKPKPPVAKLRTSRLLAYTLAMILPGVILVVVKWLGELAQASLEEVSSFRGRR